MKIKYQRNNWPEQTHEMKDETYQDILKEFGSFENYLKRLISTPVCVTEVSE
jgi:hypothetical protein